MAALNFPNSPSLNDTHTENGVTFKWNGAAWDRLGDIGAQGAAGAAGAQGAAGAAGAQGSTGPVAGSSSQVVYKDGSNNPAGSANFTFDGTNLTVSGNVSIGGTLTYEDVTNIDSVGIVTARAGVKVPDNQKVFLGTGDDLQIYHDSTSGKSHIKESGPGLLQVDTNNFSIRNSQDTEQLAYFTENAGVGLYYDNSKKFETTTTGISVTGNLDVSNHINLLGDLDMGDNDFIRLGAGDDLLIYHDGNNSAINDVGIGNLYIQGSDSIYFRDYDTSENHMVLNKNGSVDLYHNGSQKFETTTTGVTVTNDLVCDGTGDKAIRWSTSGTNKWSLYHNNGAGALVAYDNANNAERLRITSDGYLGINHTSPGTRLVVKQNNGVAYNGNAQNVSYGAAAFINESGHTNGGTYTGYQFNLKGDSQNRICSIGAITHASNNRTASLVFHTDEGGNRTEKVRITSDGKFGINTTSPGSLLSVSGGTDDDNFIRMNNEEVGLYFGAWGTGSSYPREITINGTRMDGGSSPWLRVAGQGGIKFCVDLNSERMRITPSGEVNIGGSNLNNSLYAFQVSRDLGTPNSNGTTLAHFNNANSTYSQSLYLNFNNSKDLIWQGGSGNGGMTWKMGTRGYNWEIGGTNKFAVGNSDVAINGGTDGVLNINTTDGRGPFIRFKENGTSKVWVGSAEGMGVGDQDDACLMSADNIYFRNSTDSYTTLRVSKEGRQTGYKRYPDASGTLRSNIYYPPTNQYLAYSAPSGGGKWLRFGYFSSRGRYRVTFNSTGGYYSPGSVTFDFSFTWSSPHVYVGNINELGPQYVSKFRVTSNSSGSAYYAEVYVNINSNQTNDHIHCTAQVLGTADREFNLYNYGYDLSTLTYTSGDFNI